MVKREVTNKEDDYSYEMYMNDARWSSYFRQIDEVKKAELTKKGILRVLIIGVGDGFIPTLLSSFSHCDITTFDYDGTLSPDITGDVSELSAYVKECFDVILCCQVLEHIPYMEFEKSLAQIAMCLHENGKCILSLPDSGCDLGGGVVTPVWGTCMRLRFCKWWKKNWLYNGEHYWEINATRDYPLRKIIKVIKKFFRVEKNYLVSNNRYHRFFVLSKADTE